MITMNIKKHTRAIAQQLDDDLLAIRLEELVKQIAAFLAVIYVAGLMTGTYLKKYNQKISKAFTYESSGTAESIQSPITNEHGMAQPQVYP